MSGKAKTICERATFIFVGKFSWLLCAPDPWTRPLTDVKSSACRKDIAALLPAVSLIAVFLGQSIGFGLSDFTLLYLFRQKQIFSIQSNRLFDYGTQWNPSVERSASASDAVDVQWPMYPSKG